MSAVDCSCKNCTTIRMEAIASTRALYDLVIIEKEKEIKQIARRNVELTRKNDTLYHRCIVLTLIAALLLVALLDAVMTMHARGLI